jgi:hypothetical protein
MGVRIIFYFVGFSWICIVTVLTMHVCSTCQESLSPCVFNLSAAFLLCSLCLLYTLVSSPLHKSTAPFPSSRGHPPAESVPPRHPRTTVSKNSKLSPVSLLLLSIFVKLAALPWMKITLKSSFTFFYMHFYGASLQNLWYSVGCFLFF